MRKLQDAARSLIREHGFEGVSVSEIGQLAGVAPTLISAHFGSKAGLLYSLVTANNAGQAQRARQAAAQAGSPWDRLERVIESWCADDLADIRLIAAIQGLSWTWSEAAEAQNREERRQGEELLAEILREGQASGDFRALPEARTVRMLWAIYTWGLRAAIFEGRSAAECAAETMAQARLLLAP